MTPNSRFTEFITDINPSPTTNARSQSAHNSIRDALSADADYKDSLIRDFLGGSYKRQTAIRPATKGGDTDRPDVDIYVVVEGDAWTTTPEELIDDLFNALQRNRKRLNITHLWGIHLTGPIRAGSSPGAVRWRAIQARRVPARLGRRGRHRPGPLGGDKVLVA